MLHRTAPLLATLTAAALLLPACTTVDDAVDQTEDAVSEGIRRVEWCTAAFQLSQAVEDRDLEAARDAGLRMQDSAPEELRDEFAVVLDAVEAAEAGDVEQVEGEEVRAAAEEIRATAEQQCDPTTQPE